MYDRTLERCVTSGVTWRLLPPAWKVNGLTNYGLLTFLDAAEPKSWETGRKKKLPRSRFFGDIEKFHLLTLPLHDPPPTLTLMPLRFHRLFPSTLAASSIFLRGMPFASRGKRSGELSMVEGVCLSSGTITTLYFRLSSATFSFLEWIEGLDGGDGQSGLCWTGLLDEHRREKGRRDEIWLFP
jgi:hypothetical protein